MSMLLPTLIGIAAGISSGLFGIGGGIIIIPILLLVYKMDQQSATATSLIALLLPVGSFGLWQFYRAGFVEIDNVKIGLLIALGMFAGAFLGARIATAVPGEVLSKFFAVFLVLIATRVWFL